MKFEEMTNQRRKEFDNVESVPTDLIWHGIQDNMRRNKTRRIYLRLSAAASIIVLIGAFTIFNATRTSNVVNQTIMSAEFNAEENKYYRLANNKMNEINYSELDKEEYGEIMAELAELDSMYNDIKNELASLPDAEKAIQTAIRFHERKLQILELLEKEIENRKREELNESNLKI